MRVLIVRLGAMGDILHALPAVTALRALLPAAWIGWAIEPQWASLLCSASASQPVHRGPPMPVVDALHLVPAKRWAHAPLSSRTLTEIRQLRRDLRQQHYDICVDLQGAIRSAWIGRMTGTRRLIGEAEPREPLARWLFHRRVATHGTHVIEQAREVLGAAIDISLPDTAAALPFDEDAERWCDAWLKERNIARFVMMNPGAGWGAKCWPIDRYGSVAGGLASQGYATIINAGPREVHLADAVTAASPTKIFAMTGSIGQLIACTRRTELLIGGDTGPLHLAAALKRPVVGIYGPTDPARNGPYGNRSRVLRHPASKRDHTRRHEPEAGLLTITVEEVLHAAEELLAEQRR